MSDDTVRVFGYYNRKKRKGGHSFKVGDRVIYSKSIGQGSHQASYPAAIIRVFKAKITIQYESKGQVKTIQVTHGTLRLALKEKSDECLIALNAP